MCSIAISFYDLRRILMSPWGESKYKQQVKILALINGAAGLYGRILTEVCTHGRGQDSPIQTDLARLIRCLKKTSIRLM